MLREEEMWEEEEEENWQEAVLSDSIRPEEAGFMAGYNEEEGE